MESKTTRKRKKHTEEFKREAVRLLEGTASPKLIDRVFKVWEYQVSHGQLLIRSPKAPASNTSPERLTNVDLVCLGVEYMALPRLFRGLDLAQPTRDELEQLESLLGSPIESSKVRMLASEGRRFPVVASTFSLSENDWDIFESPLEFRSQFRGLR